MNNFILSLLMQSLIKANNVIHDDFEKKKNALKKKSAASYRKLKFKNNIFLPTLHSDALLVV